MSSLAAEKRRKESLLKFQSENKNCFNCGALATYAVFPLCISACTNCCAIHRGVGHHVKSFSASSFRHEEVQQLKAVGNQAAADVWLADWRPDTGVVKPRPGDKQAAQAWIAAVFLEKSYYNSRYERRGGSSAAESESDRPGDLMMQTFTTPDGKAGFIPPLPPPPGNSVALSMSTVLRTMSNVSVPTRAGSMASDDPAVISPRQMPSPTDGSADAPTRIPAASKAGQQGRGAPASAGSNGGRGGGAAAAAPAPTTAGQDILSQSSSGQPAAAAAAKPGGGTAAQPFDPFAMPVPAAAHTAAPPPAASNVFDPFSAAGAGTAAAAASQPSGPAPGAVSNGAVFDPFAGLDVSQAAPPAAPFTAHAASVSNQAFLAAPMNMPGSPAGLNPHLAVRPQPPGMPRVPSQPGLYTAERTNSNASFTQMAGDGSLQLTASGGSGMLPRTATDATMRTHSPGQPTLPPQLVPSLSSPSAAFTSTTDSTQNRFQSSSTGFSAARVGSAGAVRPALSAAMFSTYGTGHAAAFGAGAGQPGAYPGSPGGAGAMQQGFYPGSPGVHSGHGFHAPFTPVSMMGGGPGDGPAGHGRQPSSPAMMQQMAVQGVHGGGPAPWGHAGGGPGAQYGVYQQAQQPFNPAAGSLGGGWPGAHAAPGAFMQAPGAPQGHMVAAKSMPDMSSQGMQQPRMQLIGASSMSSVSGQTPRQDGAALAPSGSAPPQQSMATLPSPHQDGAPALSPTGLHPAAYSQAAQLQQQAHAARMHSAPYDMGSGVTGMPMQVGAGVGPGGMAPGTAAFPGMQGSMGMLGSAGMPVSMHMGVQGMATRVQFSSGVPTSHGLQPGMGYSQGMGGMGYPGNLYPGPGAPGSAAPMGGLQMPGAPGGVGAFPGGGGGMMAQAQGLPQSFEQGLQLGGAAAGQWGGNAGARGPQQVPGSLPTPIERTGNPFASS